MGFTRKVEGAPNWKKKPKEQILEFQEVSEKETTHEHHERPQSAPAPPDPAELRKLQMTLEGLGRQEVQLQGKLDSLEMFLFKEKEFDWGEKRGRARQEGLPSITSVREMAVESPEGGMTSEADAAEPALGDGKHFRPPRLHC